MDKTAQTIEATKILDYAAQFGPTFVAIVAIIVTLLITRQQILATTTSVSRRQWIDSLREGLSELLAFQTGLSYLAMTGRDYKEFTVPLEKFMASDTRVQLLLDPSDTGHAALLEALLGFSDLVHGFGHATIPKPTKERAQAICNARQEVIEKCRAVIAAEWSRLKKGR